MSFQMLDILFNVNLKTSLSETDLSKYEKARILLIYTLKNNYVWIDPNSDSNKQEQVSNKSDKTILKCKISNEFHVYTFLCCYL